uniref:HMG box domain-containing protein n=1 Tax=Entamoeba invadens TaxID=33085 RepID=S0B1Z6_ENTIV|nr:hypothetical protein [Entamoeba invadens]
MDPTNRMMSRLQVNDMVGMPQIYGQPQPQGVFVETKAPVMQQKKERKKRGERKDDHRVDRHEENLKEIAQEIYVRWKTRKLVKERSYDLERAEKKAEKRWKKETAEVTRLFYKAAIMENTVLGDEESIGKKRKKEAKIKEDCHPYLLFCKEHRDELSAKYGGKEVLSVLSEMWKKLGPEEKNKYIEVAEKNKLNKTKQQEQQQQQGMMTMQDQVGMHQPPPQQQVFMF